MGDRLPHIHKTERHGQRRPNETVEIGETEPLLLSPVSAPSHPQWSPGSIRTCITLFTMLIAVNLSLQVMIPAQTRIFESIFCKQWYAEHDEMAVILLPNGSIEERLCKVPAVQREVNTLRGWMEWWDALPGLFLAIPFGILADQIGRKWVLRLSISVILLRELWITFVSAVAIPLRAVYLGSVLNIFCGGNIVAEMMFYVMLTDVTPRAKLPVIFFQLNAGGYFTGVIGPAICGGLMRLSPWYPVSCGIVLLFISSVLSFTVPETLKKAELDDLVLSDSRPGQLGIRGQLRHTWSAYVRSLRELGSIWTDWRLLFVALLFMIRRMINALDELIQRYVSLRYHWTLGDATFLFSLKACATTIILLLLLPWISTAMEDKLHLSLITNSVIITRCSLFLLALGFLVEGIAPTVHVLILGLMIETLGSGAGPALRALAGTLVEQEDNGRLFSGLAIGETLSVMAAYPLSAALFNTGIEKGGGMLLGLPYYTSAVLVATLTFIMCFLQFERKQVLSPDSMNASLDEDDLLVDERAT